MTTKRRREEQLSELMIRLKEDKDALAEILKFRSELYRQQVEIIERIIDAMIESIRRGDREGVFRVIAHTPDLGTSEAIGVFKLVSQTDELARLLLRNLERKKKLPEDLEELID